MQLADDAKGVEPLSLDEHCDPRLIIEVETNGDGEREVHGAGIDVQLLIEVEVHELVRVDVDRAILLVVLLLRHVVFSGLDFGGVEIGIRDRRTMPAHPMRVGASLTQQIQLMEPAASFVGSREEERPSFAIAERRAQGLRPEVTLDEVGLIDDEAIESAAAQSVGLVGALTPEGAAVGQEEGELGVGTLRPGYLCNEGLEQLIDDLALGIDRRDPPHQTAALDRLDDLGVALDRGLKGDGRTDPGLAESAPGENDFKAGRMGRYLPLQGEQVGRLDREELARLAIAG